MIQNMTLVLRYEKCDRGTKIQNFGKFHEKSFFYDPLFVVGIYLIFLFNKKIIIIEGF